MSTCRLKNPARDQGDIVDIMIGEGDINDTTRGEWDINIDDTYVVGALHLRYVQWRDWEHPVEQWKGEHLPNLSLIPLFHNVGLLFGYGK